ncbi:MAG: hypothetical protein GJ676_01230 [Rhodobacteraceae bacterium]|nr:hypothetical protein [Paracoccaceae bacterium]
MPISDLIFWPAAIRALIRRRGQVVMQTTRSDCGVASVLTVLNMLNRKPDPVHAMEVLDPDRQGSNLDAMRRYFVERHGIGARALKAPAANLKQLNGHVILHMSQKHYVVMLKLGRNGILVHDPAEGAVYYPMADFKALYSGVALEVSGKAVEGQLPAIVQPPPRVNSKIGFKWEPVGLFLTGVASRLLECALLLCLVAVLYLILNQASFPSMLVAATVIVACGGLMLLARQIRFEGEDNWVRRKQARLWRGILRSTAKESDLHGFRGRMERDVSGSVRRGLTYNVPQKAQLPAMLGTICIMPLALCLLHPLLGVLHVGLIGLSLLITQLDLIKVCRRSVLGTSGRYSKLTHGHDMINGVAAPELIGEVAKWSVIGFAGFSVLYGSLPAVALMFWILAGMQIVPLDFKRTMQLAPALNTGESVPSLTGSEVPLRRQRILGEPDLKIAQADRLIRVEGIKPLTMSLQQPDLTVREQRMILAEVVSKTVETLPEDKRPEIGPVRIFGPGQQASQADFEHLIIAREARAEDMSLPVPQKNRELMDVALNDPVLRDMLSCDPGDFPVFWDVRNKMDVPGLAKRLDRSHLPRVGHLTMNRLTVVEREPA